LDGALDLNDIADRVSTELVEKDDYKHILPTTDPAHLEFLMAPLDNTRELTEKTVLFFRLWAGYLFAAIREHFSNTIRVLLYQHFLNPMYVLTFLFLFCFCFCFFFVCIRYFQGNYSRQ
jgi:hypothetical protein